MLLFWELTLLRRFWVLRYRLRALFLFARHIAGHGCIADYSLRRGIACRTPRLHGCIARYAQIARRTRIAGHILLLLMLLLPVFLHLSLLLLLLFVLVLLIPLFRISHRSSH